MNEGRLQGAIQQTRKKPRAALHLISQGRRSMQGIGTTSTRSSIEQAALRFGLVHSLVTIAMRLMAPPKCSRQANEE